MPGGLLTAWWLWDRFSLWMWPTFVVPSSPKGLLRVRLTTHRGRPFELPDSARIERGAALLEIHCDNQAVLEFTRRSAAIYVAGRAEMAAIAAWVEQSDARVEAIHGTTMLGAASARLGFHRMAVASTWRARADRLFMNGLLALYNVAGVARLTRGRTLKVLPEEIWMSRAELLQRYGTAAAPSPMPRPIRFVHAIHRDGSGRVVRIAAAAAKPQAPRRPRD
ncbi:MAG: YkoP family protein [Candidatus Binataceae bacterium]